MLHKFFYLVISVRNFSDVIEYQFFFQIIGTGMLTNLRGMNLEYSNCFFLITLMGQLASNMPRESNSCLF
jgi:hypothetical protein